MIPIYRRIKNYLGDTVIEQSVIKEGEDIPNGWTSNLSDVEIKSATDQDQINKNLTLQIAQANIEIAKLKAQIGGSK